MVRLGLICHYLKTHAPSQCVKFCGFIYDTTSCPILIIPAQKISRGISLIMFLSRGVKQPLARLTLSKVIGFLQSLVPATPSNIGASFLQSLNRDLHCLKNRTLQGTLAYYFTPVQLSQESLLELKWWEQALSLGLLSKQSQATSMATLSVTWGNGSGTGTGGTLNWVTVENETNMEPLHTWMGIWKPIVRIFSSNWKEMRTLRLTLERLWSQSVSLRGTVLWYFTDNQATYDICRRSTTPSVELFKLVQKIRILELKLHCHLEVIHVPGVLMVEQGTDGLSRGILAQPFAINRGVSCLKYLFEPAPLTLEVLYWALDMSQLPFHPDWQFRGDSDSWERDPLLGRHTIWCVSPPLAKQSMLLALSVWVESPGDSSHLFVVPRVMQRDFGRVSKYFHLMSQSWDIPCHFRPVVPFLVFYLPPFDRLTHVHIKCTRLSRRLNSSSKPSTPAWIKYQVEALHGLPSPS